MKATSHGRPSTRICIITPGHPSTNPRAVKEADALAGAGHEVTLLAADYSPWARRADRDIQSHRWILAPKVPFGPYAPLDRRVVQIARQRAARLCVGLGSRDPSIVNAAWHPAGPDLVAAARCLKANLYIAHYPAALRAAALAAFKHEAAYAYDAEDFHLGDPPDGAQHETERGMIGAIERRYLPGCAYITAASPGIADAYAKAYGIQPPTVILNVFPRKQAPSLPSPSGSVLPGPSVYWFSQTIGPDRGLECAVRAIGQARTRPHLFLRGTPAAGFLDRLQAIAVEAGATERLHILPPAAPSEMVRFAATYDAGLVGETGHTASRRIALTNKLFTYLVAGIPAIMSDIPAQRALAPGLGKAARIFPIDDPTALAAALDALLSDPAALARARAAAWGLGQERYNWEREQAVLQDLMCRVQGQGERDPVSLPTAAPMRGGHMTPYRK